MSDSDSRKRNCTEAELVTNPLLTKNKFTLIDEGEQLDSIKKRQLFTYSTTSSSIDCFNNNNNNNNNNSDELNNNFINTKQQTFVQEEIKEGSKLLNMDSKRKSNDDTSHSNKLAPANNMLTASDLNDKKARGQEEPAIPSSPAYTSIFAPTNQQQRTGSRAPLKKQEASDLEPVSTIDRLSTLQGKKTHGSTYNSKYLTDEDEQEDDEIDERLPFSSSMTKQGSIKRKPSPEPQQQQYQQQQKCSSKHSLQFQHDNRCDRSMSQLHQQNKHSPHTKISFNDSRPPSFNTCQFSHHHHHQQDNNSGSKLDWHDQCSQNSGCGCYPVDFSRDVKKLHGANEIATYTNGGAFNTKYSRTRSLHLVLKSIILILLTLLLLMLFVGIILASHYLPQVFERVLGATRSFNVTIAG